MKNPVNIEVYEVLISFDNRFVLEAGITIFVANIINNRGRKMEIGVTPTSEI